MIAGVVLGGLTLLAGATTAPSFTGTYRTKGHELRLLQCGRRIVGGITGFDENGADLWNGVRATAAGMRAIGRVLWPGSDYELAFRLDGQGLRLRYLHAGAGIRLSLQRESAKEPDVPPERYFGEGCIERDGWSVDVPERWLADRNSDPLLLTGRDGARVHVWSARATDEAGVRGVVADRLRDLALTADAPLALTPPSPPASGALVAAWHRALGGGIPVGDAGGRTQAAHVVALFRPDGSAVIALAEGGSESPGCTRHRVESIALSILFRRKR